MDFIEPEPGSFLFNSAAFMGSFGIALFFLISGFVIPFSLELGPGQFIMRRIFRLYPVALVATFFAMLVHQLSGREISHFWETISLFGIFFAPNESLLQTVYWTLSIEMTLYLVALIAYSLSKSTLFARVSREVPIIYGLLLTALALFAWLMETIGKQQLQVWQVGLMVVLTCLPVLFVGWFMNLFQTNQINYSLLVLGILICIFVIFRSPYPVYFSPEIGMPSWAIALIVFTLLLILPSISESYWKIPLLIGSISYPLYVFHVPISQLVEIVAIPTASKFAIFFGLCFIISILVHLCVEKPFMRLGKSFNFPKKSLMNQK